MYAVGSPFAASALNRLSRGVMVCDTSGALYVYVYASVAGDGPAGPEMVTAVRDAAVGNVEVMV